MTPEAEQNAMLERLLFKHLRTGKNGASLAALRELLLAVQEKDAVTVEMNECGNSDEIMSCHAEDAKAIREQRYEDLF